jgi:hypothetical protein
MEQIEDKVNHPNHYTSGKIEVIEFIKDRLSKKEFEGYITGNVIKYISRWKLKGGYEDLKKAMWYLDYLIQNYGK